MRITVVEPNGSGGMIHYAYQMCKALENQGADVTLVTDKDYELLDYPHNFHVENRLKLWSQHDPQSSEVVYKSGFQKLYRKVKWTIRRGIRAYYLINAWFELSNFLLESSPDIVQFGKINFPFEAIFLKRLKDRGLILTQICHEFERRESSGLVSGWVDSLYNDVFQNFSFLFFHAEENRQRFRSLFDYQMENTLIIPHGNQGIFLNLGSQTDIVQRLRDSYQLANDEIAVLFFGVLAPSKGVSVLIDAFSKIKNSQGVKLVVAGYPSKHINLEKIFDQIEKLSLTERVVLDLRYIPNEEVPSIFEISDVVVYPYLSSTQSGSIQVAYALGKPVVASSVGGLPEVVEDGKSGLLVKPNDPGDLAEKLDFMIDEVDLRLRMGRYAKELSETKFSWDSIAATILDTYRKF